MADDEPTANEEAQTLAAIDGAYCAELSRMRHEAVEIDGLTWEQACAAIPG